MADYKVNRWVSFLRKYGPIPTNDNMYDESIQRAILRNGITPIRLDTGHLQELVANFNGPRPASVVLTGTAGDGKTYLCREVWTALGGTSATWDVDAKTRTLSLPSGLRLVVIKDLSEFHGSDYAELERMARAVLSDSPAEVFLVAANDGQLVEAWTRAPAGDEVSRVAKCIEGLLVSGDRETDGANLRLFNLSRSDTAALFAKAIAALSTHPGWQGCHGCRGQLPEPENRCPIWENYQRLQQPLLTERLNELLQLCDRNGFHLPLRQLLILASNSILGHPDGKEGLAQCKDVPEIVRRGRTAEGSIYSNVFGGNLVDSRRASTEVMEVLGRFGIGEETSNRIDNLLVFGADEPGLRPLFDRLLRSDPVYGAHGDFLRLQAAYLEGVDDEACQDFLTALPGQRRRLFFTMPEVEGKDLRLWDLTVFQYAGEFLDHVLRPLGRGEKVPRNILGRLVQGMNRIFTGLLTTTDRELVLASSGSFSQSRISRIEEYSLSVDPRKGERVVLEQVRSGVELAVYFETARRAALPLNVLRYEFLSRVAEGAMPSSFSRECYEDILSFKSRLLREWLQMRRSYGEEAESVDEMQLKLLELDHRGKIVIKALAVKLLGTS